MLCDRSDYEGLGISGEASEIRRFDDRTNNNNYKYVKNLSDSEGPYIPILGSEHCRVQWGAMRDRSDYGELGIPACDAHAIPC